MPLRVVFFGTPGFAVPTLERLMHSRHSVVGVVTQPDRPRGRGQQITDGPVKTLAASMKLPILQPERLAREIDRKSTRLNSSHSQISYAVFCLKKKKNKKKTQNT